ncbi:MAG: hypothetical protein IPL33_16700 [Sphingobacteriales bacterium]|nr:hypothetical protein [Sphingobacteriales bacterium]
MARVAADAVLCRVSIRYVPLAPNPSAAMDKAAAIAYDVFTNIDPLTDDYHQPKKKTIEKATAAYVLVRQRCRQFG